ncbi:hypothetical protein D3C78_1547300 [compost metagenome]
MRPVLTERVLGFLRVFSASRRISGAMVAEKSSDWRFSGIAPRILSSSSAKPMSSISSASSSTSVSHWVRLRAPFSMKSTKRPGVPTTRRAPF